MPKRTDTFSRKANSLPFGGAEGVAQQQRLGMGVLQLRASAHPHLASPLRGRETGLAKFAYGPSSGTALALKTVQTLFTHIQLILAGNARKSSYPSPIRDKAREHYAQKN